MKPIHQLVLYISLSQAALTAVRFVAALYLVQAHYSPAVIGVMMALFSVGALVYSVPIGRWVDRAGSVKPLVTCCSLLVIGSLMCAISQSLWVLGAAAFLAGIGGFGQHVVTNLLAGSTGDPGDRSSNFALLTTGVAAANAVAPYLMGLLIDHMGRFTLIFALIGVLPAICLALSFAGRFPRSAAQARGAAGSRKGSALDLLRDPKLRPIMIVGTLFVLLYDVFAVATPLYGAHLRMSASDIGLVVSVFSVAAFSVRLVIGPLSRLTTPWRSLLASLSMSGFGLIAFGFSEALVMLVIFAFIIGAGQGVGAPVSSAVMYEAAPPGRISEAMGLRMSLAMVTPSCCRCWPALPHR